MFSAESPVLVGLFDDRAGAARAVEGLRAAGFSDDVIGFAIRENDVVHGGMVSDSDNTLDVKEAAGGAAVGGALAAGLAAVVSLTIPGVGPIVAGGVLAVALGYGAAGAAIGGIVGALHGLGVSEEEARDYEKEFHEGRAIVAVRAGERSGEAGFILRQNGGIKLRRETNFPVPMSGQSND